MSTTRGRLFRALTGRDADVSGNPQGDIKGMLLAVGGASTRTRSGIDLTKAAKSLGVSRRTVERWVKTAESGSGQRPSPAHSKTLASKARQVASTKAGRKRLADEITRRLTGSGEALHVSVYGLQGPVTDVTSYDQRGIPVDASTRPRARMTTVVLPFEQVPGMVQAWVDGGEDGFKQWATQQWDGSGVSNYLEGWRFFDVADVECKPGPARQ